MSIKKMKKEDLELLNNKEITNLILEESKKPINTADLFKEIVKLLELPKSFFDEKIGDYYTALSTDKRFILLEDGTWDLRSRHTSDKVIKIIVEDDEDDEELIKEDSLDLSEEDSYDDNDEEEYDATKDEDLKDLVILDEDELELEQ